MKNFSEMAASEKYNEFKNESDNDSHIDRMPTAEECRIAREEDAKQPKEDFSFFLQITQQHHDNTNKNRPNTR